MGGFCQILGQPEKIQTKTNKKMKVILKNFFKVGGIILAKGEKNKSPKNQAKLGVTGFEPRSTTFG
jgi:hypothetical protein